MREKLLEDSELKFESSCLKLLFRHQKENKPTPRYQDTLLKMSIKHFRESSSQRHSIQRLNYTAGAHSVLSTSNSLQQNGEIKFNNLYVFKAKSTSIFWPFLYTEGRKHTT